MTTATPERGHGEQDGPGGQNPLTPPEPTSLETWMRQVLGLAGARASAFVPPPPPPAPPIGRGHPPDEDATGAGRAT